MREPREEKGSQTLEVGEGNLLPPVSIGRNQRLVRGGGSDRGRTEDEAAKIRAKAAAIFDSKREEEVAAGGTIRAIFLDLGRSDRISSSARKTRGPWLIRGSYRGGSDDVKNMELRVISRGMCNDVRATAIRVSWIADEGQGNLRRGRPAM